MAMRELPLPPTTRQSRLQNSIGSSMNKLWPANVQLALFCLDHGNVGQARKCLAEARDLHGQWGAYRKVGDVRGLFVTL